MKTLQNAASDLDLHCLPMSQKWDAGHLSATMREELFTWLSKGFVVDAVP